MAEGDTLIHEKVFSLIDNITSSVICQPSSAAHKLLPWLAETVTLVYSPFFPPQTMVKYSRPKPLTKIFRICYHRFG